MTTNQIEYAKLKENERHNLRTEELTDWRNKADIAIADRNTTVSENALTWRKEIESLQQKETERHNKQIELYNAQQAEAALSQAGAAWYNARTQEALRASEIALNQAKIADVEKQTSLRQYEIDTKAASSGAAGIGWVLGNKLLGSESGSGIQPELDPTLNFVGSAITGYDLNDRRELDIYGDDISPKYSQSEEFSGGGRNFNSKYWNANK